ncbi:hypothetical protein [Sphingosinicella sp. BN140058]|uniref:hypothetical protein n=1 Tax=Sphingosinicella sp. BN140058 TaxID=1892855 RepID=UPI001011C7AF|nr:hypothetical protein [Sphingosinicella sp. BN140058]QAY79413.1 hypothetical protein ETR14_24880 [Sphingosinicella sp. BN140058]
MSDVPDARSARSGFPVRACKGERLSGVVAADRVGQGGMEIASAIEGIVPPALPRQMRDIVMS